MIHYLGAFRPRNSLFFLSSTVLSDGTPRQWPLSYLGSYVKLRVLLVQWIECAAGWECQRVLKYVHKQGIGGERRATAGCLRVPELLNHQAVHVLPHHQREESMAWCFRALRNLGNKWLLALCYLCDQEANILRCSQLVDFTSLVEMASGSKLDKMSSSSKNEATRLFFNHRQCKTCWTVRVSWVLQLFVISRNCKKSSL